MAVPARTRARLQHAIDTGREPALIGRGLYILQNESGRGGIKLRDAALGNVTPAGAVYRELLDARGGPYQRFEHLGYFHPDATVLPALRPGRRRNAPPPRTDYAISIDGTRRKLATWRPGEGRMERTWLGGHFGGRQQFVVQIPVIRVYPRG